MCEVGIDVHKANSSVGFSNLGLNIVMDKLYLTSKDAVQTHGYIYTENLQFNSSNKTP